MLDQANHIIQKLYRQKIVYRWIEIGLLSLSAGLIIAGIVYYIFTLLIPAATSGILTGIIACFFLLKYYQPSLSIYLISQYLNKTIPELQQSTELIIQDADKLPPLLQYQQQRVSETLIHKSSDIHLPHRLSLAIGSLITACVVIAGAIFFPLSQNQLKPASPSSSATIAEDQPEDLQPLTIQDIELTISPPIYTGLSERQTSQLNQEIPEGALLTWKVDISPMPLNAYIEIHDDQKLNLSEKGPNYQAGTFKLTQNTLYAYHIQQPDSSWIHSSYYQLLMIPDATPTISVEGLPAYMEIPFEDSYQVHFEVSITDDYGISDAQIVMMISRGEGEQVKFRTETTPIETGTGTSFTKSISLPLPMAELEPGDEVYLHIEASDNKTPLAQNGKSATYLIGIEDTSKADFTIDTGMGIDRIPEYFRSQRQIIIDTEKLIADRNNLNEKSFQKHSNDIGIDQKLLRLRYGKFLGEEFESTSGGNFRRNTPVQPEGSEAHDHHDHDHDHESTDTHTHEAHDHHDHDHESTNTHTHEAHDHHDHDHGPQPPTPDTGPSLEELMEPYVHFHDMAEELTYFDEAVRGKLKAALSLMWDAELHLRTFRPEAALPYEYKALKLIKEVQQQSRVYVARVGLDIPPLKPEHRLTGDLDEVSDLQLDTQIKPDEDREAIRDGLQLIQSMTDPSQIDEQQRAILREASSALVNESLQTPLVYLPALGMLSSLLKGEIPPEAWPEAKATISRGMMKSLPDQQGYRPISRPGNSSLQEEYLKQLTQ